MHDLSDQASCVLNTSTIQYEIQPCDCLEPLSTKGKFLEVLRYTVDFALSHISYSHTSVIYKPSHGTKLFAIYLVKFHLVIFQLIV